jgi:hypothetical protein
LSRLREIAVDSAKESLVFTGIAIPFAYPILLWLNAVHLTTVYPDAFGFALLIEACLLMLAGGALDIGSTGSAKRIYAALARKNFEYDRDETRKQVNRAAVYSVTGVVLFVESLAVALVLAA